MKTMTARILIAIVGTALFAICTLQTGCAVAAGAAAGGAAGYIVAEEQHDGDLD